MEDSVPGNRPAVSRRASSWLLLLPMLFFATHGRFWFAGTGDARSPAGYLLFVVVHALVLWAILSKARAVLALAWRMRLMMVLAVLTIVSALWSQDPVRSLSNGTFYLLDTLFALCLVVSYSIEELMELCMMAGAVAGVLSLALVVTLPSVGMAGYTRAPGAWRGLFQDRNTCAMFSVFFLSPALSFGRLGFTYKRFAYVALMALLVLKAEAVTALLVLVAYVTFLVVLRAFRRLGPRTGVAFAMILTPPFLIGGVLLALHSGDLLQLLGRDPTLTGRTEIWAVLFRSIAKRPLLGYGFYAFWLGLAGESANEIINANWVFGYAHNGALEVVLQLGLIGLLLFLAMFSCAVADAWTCWRRDRSPGVEWMISLLALTVFYNISEETIVWPNDILTILLLCACAGLSLAASRVSLTVPVPPRVLHDLSPA